VKDHHQSAPTVPTDVDLMSRDIDFCTPDSSVHSIACIMADRNVGSIPVVNGTDHMIPTGILTDRDIVIRVVAPGLEAIAVRVDQCMSLDVQTICSNAPVSEAAAIMQRHHLRRLPVTDDTSCLVGILSHADLTRPADAAQNAETIRELSEPVA
jgi:CBS domain-containing protein